MEKTDINLSSAEISALWATYIQSSATTCFYKNFLQHMKDQQIKPLIEEALLLNENTLKRITEIFNNEEFPIPIGFSAKDIDLSAPAILRNNNSTFI
ncbi:DUF3231 family protein [Metabacillus herbersteinensis]|uniref:DUF3231 family protein n=1 Tax=Metabacillus herbersteinensis TaxID=283816 RepID=A0ABV6GEK4_9BACI